MLPDWYKEVPVVVEPADSRIVQWATSRSFPCYYARVDGLPIPCLKVHLGQVTAFVNQGRLTRIAAQADHDDLDELFWGLTELLAVCGRQTEMVLEETTLI
jgi:hypothetical protein